MQEYQQAVEKEKKEMMQTKIFVEQGVFKISLVRANSSSEGVNVFLNFIGGNVEVDKVRYKLLKVTKATNLGVPVYLSTGPVTSYRQLPMISGVTTLGVAEIPLSEKKVSVSVTGLGGYCLYHNEWHSINGVDGNLTIN